MKTQIATTKAPAAIGPYSQAIEANGIVFVSGQLPIDPATGEFAQGGVKELTRQSLTNMQNILAEAGLTMDNVVKTTVFLADMADFADMNSVYAELLNADRTGYNLPGSVTLPQGMTYALVASRESKYSPIITLAVRCVRKSLRNTLMAQPVFSTEVRFQGDPNQ